jgi:hypothetical protein
MLTNFFLQQREVNLTAGGNTLIVPSAATVTPQPGSSGGGGAGGGRGSSLNIGDIIAIALGIPGFIVAVAGIIIAWRFRNRKHWFENKEKQKSIQPSEPEKRKAPAYVPSNQPRQTLVQPVISSNRSELP